MTSGAPGLESRTVHRSIHERLVVTGTLVLDTPARFGNGDPGDITDMPLLVDEFDGRPLITGASLAGALRNYMREYQQGYDRAFGTAADESGLYAATLFGGHRGDPEGDQSPLIVDDARAVDVAVVTELRDGVAIDPATGTAAEGKKYDYDLLPAGTRFHLRFELLQDNNTKNNRRRLDALAQTLHALQQGDVRLGARKRRGFGRCHVDTWAVTRYRLTDPEDLVAWLEACPAEEDAKRTQQGSDVLGLLGAMQLEATDARRQMELEAAFAVDGSLLVRSGSGLTGPDMVHLQTYDPQRGRTAPVLPGTSLGGALRHRALRIVNTLAGAGKTPEDRARKIVTQMFGPDPEEIKDGSTQLASRLVVEEQLLKGGTPLVQSRVKIDRFTGGTVDGALFDEAPHFGGSVTIKLSLRNPQEAEVGLLLLLLKDLWLGDLTVGGEASVGRGRLQGENVTLRLPDREEPITLTTGHEENSVVISGAGEKNLQAYVDALSTFLQEEETGPQEAEA